MEYDQELDDLFKTLGFINFKEFMKAASPLDPLSFPEPVTKNALSPNDLYSDPDEIGYIFIVDKDEETGKWHIHSIHAAVQMDTNRNIEGVNVIGKDFQRCNGAIPGKEAIRKEMLQRIRAETVREHSICKMDNRLSLPKKNRKW